MRQPSQNHEMSKSVDDNSVHGADPALLWDDVFCTLSDQPRSDVENYSPVTSTELYESTELLFLLSCWSQLF
ncbi:hypothetical protein J6590_066465 [Homalodisca vitripennis]|nr:hypothetical protein J6590_066465 [Homalodisca vitripennis]